MMSFHNISTLAHTMEDIFYHLREKKPEVYQFADLSDLVLAGIDFIKNVVEKIKNNTDADGDSSSLVHKTEEFLKGLKENSNAYRAVIYFEEGCEMENIRAYTVIRDLMEIADQVMYIPEDILDNDETIDIIRREGFRILIKTNYTYEMMKEFLTQIIFLKDLELTQVNDEEAVKSFYMKKPEMQTEQVVVEQATGLPTEQLNKITTGQLTETPTEQLSEIPIEQLTERPTESLTDQRVIPPKAMDPNTSEKSISPKDMSRKDMRPTSTSQSIISVSVAKLDRLMDLVGEMVISETMVVQNPELFNLDLDSFHKAASQLNKITTEIQDLVMSIRMVPLSATFNKMHRIVRDMCKKLNKDVGLEIIGEATEVDKNIIEHISDPLMHLVRNSIDHGIEAPDERLLKGKPARGMITLEAINSGSDVLILIKDDGKGLDRDKILKKAKENRLLIKKDSDMTDREVFNLILLPGFSTNDNITEYSGRGVGMDVVAKNIETVGGSISIDSIPDKGVQITLKIPLTMAIIDGMNIKVGDSRFTIPIASVKQSFQPKEGDIFFDTDNNELIMVRGQCYPIVRLHKKFGIKTKVTNLTDGIIIMVEQGEQTICIFTDELIGQQQVVVKTLPEYIQRFKIIRGLSGCTLLGDGSISLMIDVAALMSL